MHAGGVASDARVRARRGCWPNWIYHTGETFNYQSAGSVGRLVLVSRV